MTTRLPIFALTQVAELLNKMKDTDSDLRTMALMDLNKELSRQPAAITSSTSLWNTGKAKEGFFIADEVTEHAIVEMALKLLVDTNSEVKNLAVTCVAGLSRKPRLTSLKNITNQLLEGISATDEEQRDISCLALKSVVSDMPTDGEPLVPFVENINKKVLSVLTQPDPNPQLASELLQILTDMYAKYPAWATRNNIQTPAIESLVQVLDSGRPSLRKRAIPAVSALVATDPSLFDKPVKGKIVEGLSKGGEGARIWVGVIASLAKGQSVGKVGGLVGEGKLIGMILDQASDPTQTEAVEGSLAALETLVLRCPAEMATAINPILNRALELVKYDPNFVEIDEDEDDVDMNGDDEDDDFDDGEYSDDEDDSWKIRRSAAKLLQSIFGTRLELLLDFYDNAAGVLISKFNEREESVRVEILTAFEVLLNQTAVARNAELASGGRNKRKRSHDMDEDTSQDDSAVLRLQACLPQFLSGTLKELSAKSAPTRQQAFVLLRQAADILQGGLETSADAICKAVTQSLKSVDTAATSSLAIAALSFLSTFFATHHPRVYGSHVESLVNAMTRCMKDKLHRISAEAFGAASSLAHTARPKGTSSPLAVAFTGPIEKLLQATTEVLGDTTVDTDIRERALETLGDLLVHEGDILTQSYPTALPLIKSRLANEASASTAMQVIGRIAEAPTCGGQVFEDWLLQVLPDVMVALRKSKRSAGKNTEFVCLQHVLYRIASSLPVDTADALIIELKAFIETPSALQAVALILEHQPQCRHTVTEQVLPSIKSMLATPTNNPLLNDALAVFCGAYVRGDPNVATSLATELVANVKAGTALPDATAGGTSVSASTARCIGAVVGAAPQSSSQVLHIFEKSIKSSKAAEADIYLALLSIGEIGRVSDLSGSQAVFDKVLKYTTNESEEVRSAAAFAAGNMAVGAPDAFLPELVSKIEGADTEAERILFLHALKEVILHSSSAQLEALADHSWSPLFAQDSELANSDISEDSVRNVKAACIGKLTTTAPHKFLPELQNLLTSSVRDRALVAAAVRYTFIDTSSSFDELIAPIIIDFLSLVHDENVVVRRLSLASFNAAIQNKPHLIIDKLNVLQPMLYQETVVRPELQREVQMGPWKVIEDDGLENRKTALETMYTMLGTCFTKIDLPTFIERVLDALKDHNDVKPLALMLLLRLGQLAPTSIIPRLDDTVESFRTIMKDVEVKDDTVKQDLERKEEMQKAALRTAVPLYKLSNQGQAPEFHAFVLKQLSMEKWKEFKNYKV